MVFLAFRRIKSLQTSIIGQEYLFLSPQMESNNYCPRLTPRAIIIVTPSLGLKKIFNVGP